MSCTCTVCLPLVSWLQRNKPVVHSQLSLFTDLGSVNYMIYVLYQQKPLPVPPLCTLLEDHRIKEKWLCLLGYLGDFGSQV